MKKIIMLFLVLSIMLGLVGCSSIRVGFVENVTSGKMTASYMSFTGTKECSVNVKEGEPIDIKADIETKKGIIDVYIYKDKDNYEYEGHDLETSNFTVTLSDPGDYTIKVVTKKHKGSYTFQWK